ncbi:MAG TPA: FAD-dependent oxidoreductase [Acidimicrobiales bacterium]|nr:FAD-dependent oxidoreductase [Acidimicrobiales bacterium]
MRRVAVVGGSLAGLTAARTIRRQGHQGPVVVIGAEPHLPYQRPPLSKEILSGKWQPERAQLKIEDGLDLEFRTGVRAASLSVDDRTIGLDDGTSLDFDGLVIATGADVRRLPGLPDLQGVHYLRTIDDCLAIRRAMESGPRVAVIGAGFIGSEVAATCRGQDLDVTVVEAMPVPLERALGPTMGEVVARLHRQHGTDIRLGAAVEGLDGSGRVRGVRLGDGEVVAADLVVVGVGVKPATEWLEGSGLRLDDGVVCDATCRALREDGGVADDIVAAGDVARWAHPLFGEEMRFEHWDNAVAQGQAAAGNLLRAAPEELEPFDHVPYFWSDQYGSKLQFVGTAQPDDEVTVVEGSVDDWKFVAAYRRQDRVVGALLVNRMSRMPAYQKLIAEGGPVPAA